MGGLVDDLTGFWILGNAFLRNVYACTCSYLKSYSSLLIFCWFLTSAANASALRPLPYVLIRMRASPDRSSGHSEDIVKITGESILPSAQMCPDLNSISIPMALQRATDNFRLSFLFKSGEKHCVYCLLCTWCLFTRPLCQIHDTTIVTFAYGMSGGLQQPAAS